MAFLTRVRASLNSALRPLNVKFDTLTADRHESGRLDALDRAGLFERPVYAMLPGMQAFDPRPLASAALVLPRP